MRFGIQHFLLSAMALAMVLTASAQDVAPDIDVNKAPPIDLKKEAVPRTDSVSQEFSADYSYTGNSDAHRGNLDLGGMDEQWSKVKYVVSPDLGDGILLRLGGTWERFSFGPNPGVPIPDTLQSTALLLGADIELSDKWLMRLEIEPGLYSDFENTNFNDFNAPLTVGFSYVVNADFQWFFGASADFRRKIPVIPGAGFRWHFADDWTLMFLLPNPRIEYKINDSLTAFVGAELKGGTYRTGDNFGTATGQSRLNNASIEYTEGSVGGGISWAPLPYLSVDLEGGYLVYRRFDYANAHTQVGTDPAPYVQIGTSLKF